jgi:hypothetical protein
MIKAFFHHNENKGRKRVPLTNYARGIEGGWRNSIDKDEEKGGRYKLEKSMDPSRKETKGFEDLP